MQSSDDQLESSASRIKSISSWKKTDQKLPNLFGKDRKGLKDDAKTRETSVNSSVKWNSAKLTGLSTPHDPFLRKPRKRPQPEQKPFFVIRDCSPPPADVQKALSELGSQRSREEMLSAEKHMRSRLRQSQLDELSKDINMTDKQFKHRYGDGLFKFVRDEEDKYLRAKELYLKKKSNPFFKLNADQDLGASRSSNASGINSEIAASRSSTGPRYGSDFVVSTSNNQSQVIGNNSVSNRLDALGWFRYNIFDGSKKSAQNESYLQHLQKSSSVKSQLKISTPVKSILLVTKKADKSLRIGTLSQSPK